MLKFKIGCKELLKMSLIKCLFDLDLGVTTIKLIFSENDFFGFEVACCKFYVQ